MRKVGDKVTFDGPGLKYFPHRKHTATVVAVDDENVTYQCECGDSWIVAVDTEELGSSDAPEG